MPRRPPLSPVLVVVTALATPALAPAEGGPAGAAAGDVAEYVVLLAPDVAGVDRAAAELLAPFGERPGFVYDDALTGFSVHLTPEQAARLAHAPAVDAVERSRTFAPAGGTVPTGLARIGGAGLVGTGTRIAADVAVLDTGLDASHRDLWVHRRVDCTRPVTVTTDSSWIPFVSTSGSRTQRRECAKDRGDDDSGHGTHVAGVIGAKDDGRGVVGVAPGVRLWGVKVLTQEHGGGSTAEVVAGIEYATEHAHELEVVNLSFVARGRSEATDRAIDGALRAGLVVVAAAGNAGDPASWYTPANSPGVITVSAITDLDGEPGGRAGGSCDGGDDQLALYSNYGRSVTIAAPGSCILSTAVGGGTARYSGTSVAAPHVAGAAARHIALTGEPRRASRWERTRDAILAGATPQHGPCGFARGRSPEPLLRLTGC